jgi:hypothetical protein
MGSVPDALARRHGDTKADDVRRATEWIRFATTPAAPADQAAIRARLGRPVQSDQVVVDIDVVNMLGAGVGVGEAGRRGPR